VRRGAISFLSQEDKKEKKMATSVFQDDCLAGKKAIVTGGAHGLGLAITQSLLRAGVKVAVIARSRAKYEASGLPADATTFLEADLASAEEAEAAASAAVKWAGGCVDILVNNAGIAHGALDLWKLPVADWDRVMAVNVRAPFILTQAVAPGMMAAGRGKIVNISSQAGQMGIPKHSAYCSSKGALDSLTRATTVELAPHGVQVNSIGPTVILTDMGTQIWGGDKGKPMLSITPVGRFARPEEVANAVLYLCTDASAIICGQSILMEGGAATTYNL
jgi:NAD(P)-dependent dehydrogenase (short-subunit alcohol dehydrogenase family)